MRYGVTNWLEVRGGVGSYVANVDPEPGYSGSSLGLKVGLLQNSPAQVALQSSVGLPTGTGAYNSDIVTQQAKVLFGVPIAGPVSFASNVGHTVSYDNAGTDETMLTTTFALSASESVGIGLGYAGFFTDGINRNYLEGGATYRAASNTQLDVNWAYQIDDYGSQLLLGFGIAHRF